LQRIFGGRERPGEWERVATWSTERWFWETVPRISKGGRKEKVRRGSKETSLRGAGAVWRNGKRLYRNDRESIRQRRKIRGNRKKKKKRKELSKVASVTPGLQTSASQETPLVGRTKKSGKGKGEGVPERTQQEKDSRACAKGSVVVIDCKGARSLRL